jgi:hypothetical protein
VRRRPRFFDRPFLDLVIAAVAAGLLAAAYLLADRPWPVSLAEPASIGQAAGTTVAPARPA